MHDLIQAYGAARATYPSGAAYLVIPAGRGMLRRLRKLHVLTGLPCEARSRQGKCIAYCGSDGNPFLTWGGQGRPVPHCRSVRYVSPRSGARGSSTWKPSASVERRKQVRIHLSRLGDAYYARQPLAPLPVLSDGCAEVQE